MRLLTLRTQCEYIIIDILLNKLCNKVTSFENPGLCLQKKNEHMLPHYAPTQPHAPPTANERSGECDVGQVGGHMEFSPYGRSNYS